MKKKINEPEDRSIQIIQSEEQTEKSKWRLRVLWDFTKYTNIYKMGVQAEERKAKRLLKEIIAKISQI